MNRTSLIEFSQILAFIGQYNMKTGLSKHRDCVLISQQITAPSSTPLIDAVTPSPGTPNAVGVLTGEKR